MRLPTSLEVALASVTGASTVVVALPAPVDLAQVQSAWAQPAWNALVHGRIATIAIIANNADDTRIWTAQPPGPWQRVARSLARDDLARALAAAGEPS